ncbi:lipoyl synthase [Candidatus Paraluminiphilus aquimaris]|uniref:Lipoyl synthase n=1 Tax=Candidatus Paraluminiphilus aquimaris TaxID=2518994 RepID=A0ABY6Q770_9GAMM|nr:lipoyl synthase [Candidatus Paraluminiphilus aquimaris]UZP75139.1 lipoyl synthase [Candidatus Paraluminiphilus aquimaris]
MVEKVESNLIPAVNVASGEKFVTPSGIHAIKDGIKTGKSDATRLKKPDFLKMRVRHSPKYESVKDIVKQHRLATVCEEAKCPNISECWSAGTATIMLMGDVCTRACRFCSVNTGNPKGWLDHEEPENTAKAVELMGLSYVVLTSVNRDDLPDGGAGHYAQTVREVKRLNPNTGVEALTPDFLGLESAIDTLLDSGLDVFAQNVETVQRLTHPVRDPRAGYRQTLDVLEYAARNSDVITKTSLMLGLGETDDELRECMDDLRKASVDVLTLGQYLQPTKNHLPVERFVTPDEFERYRVWGLEKGFKEVVSGVFVRSSYRAERVLEFNNVGLESP